MRTFTSVFGLAALIAGCSGGISPTALPTSSVTTNTPLSNPAKSTKERLYVSGDRESGSKSTAEILVYDVGGLSKTPKLAETRVTSTGFDGFQSYGMATDATGDLYVAAWDVATTGSGIEVYKKGSKKAHLDYVMPTGESSIEVAVAPNGTIYGLGGFDNIKGTSGVVVEAFTPGKRKPTQRIVVSSGPNCGSAPCYNQNKGVAVDAQSNLWVAYLRDNVLYVAEYAPGSKSGTVYTPSASGLDGEYFHDAIALDNSGHLLLGAILQNSSGYEKGAAIFSILPSSLQYEGFIYNGCNCGAWSFYSLAFSANTEQLWGVDGANNVDGITYPGGVTKIDFTPPWPQGSGGWFTVGVALGPR